MKKMYFNILVTLAISCLTTSRAWALIIANYSKQPIYVMTATGEDANKYLNLPDTAVKISVRNALGGELKLGHGNRIDTDDLSKLPLGMHKHLSVRIENGPYYDLSFLFNEIEQQKNYHPRKKPILAIIPPERGSGYWSGWTYRIDWE